MTEQEVKDVVFGIAAKVCEVDESEISLETKWIDDLNVKSVYAIKICALLKMKANADVAPDELAQNETIADTVQMVLEKIA